MVGFIVPKITRSASTTAQGIVELATSAETITGTDTSRAVTPAGAAATFPRYGYRNLLHNGGFQVAQRGTSFTAASTPANNDDTYLVDGALLLSDGNDIVDVTVFNNDTFLGFTQSGGAVRAQIETASKKFGWLFPLESSICKQVINEGKASLQLVMRGSTSMTSVRVMLLAWDGTTDAITSDVISAWGSFGAAPTLATNWTDEIGGGATAIDTNYTKYTFEDIDVDTSGVKNLAVFVMVDSEPDINEYFYIADVQLEAGPVCTQYEHRPYSVDLMLCQRYFQNLTRPLSTPFAVGYAVISTSIRFMFGQTSPMRTTPSASSMTILAYGGNASKSGSSLSINIDSIGRPVGSIAVTGAIYDSYSLTTSDNIWLSAEL